MSKIIGCGCLVCGNEMHKVAEENLQGSWSYRFYCPTCDESYWHKQDDIPISVDVKIKWNKTND